MGLSSSSCLVVASLACRENREALGAAAAVPRGARGVEIRVDGFEEAPDFPRLRAAYRDFVLLATVRSEREGGMFRGSAGEAARLLSGALASGFDLVDVEALAPGGQNLFGLPPSRVVASVHDPRGTPADLDALARRLAATGARYRKLVVLSASPSDTLRLLSAQRRSGDPALACLAMGEFGLASRVLAPYLGASLSFGTFDGGAATAPGQLPASDLAWLYGVGRRREIEGVCLLLGSIVSHSLSPALHNANFEAGDDPLLYVPFALRSLASELGPLRNSLGALGLPLRGASVTVPFKGEAALLCGSAGPVNTLLPAPGGLRGENTDRDAFDAVLPAPRGSGRALVLGAGGTARTAAESLRAKGWSLDVVSRTPARTATLAEAVGATALTSISGADHSWAVVVNATPLGLASADPLPCPEGLVTPGTLFVDAPYRPGGTALVRLCSDRGAEVADGFRLLVLQAARQASLFTGREASAASLVAALPEMKRRFFEAPR